MNVRELLEKTLQENGFDGLLQEDGECACQIGDLVPCESDFTNCKPGYKTLCNCNMGCDFHITTRPTPLALDGGDSAALQALSTPEVLSTLQGESTPAHRK